MPSFRAEEGLRGEVAEGEDHHGLDGLDLGHEKRVARRHLVRLGIAIAFRPALHHVRDIAVSIAVEADASRGEHPGEELARAADEGDALLFLFLARAFADDHQAGAGDAEAEDDGRSALAELAELTACAGLFLDAQRFRPDRKMADREMTGRETGDRGAEARKTGRATA